MSKVKCKNEKEHKKQKTKQWYFSQNLFCKEIQSEYQWRLNRIREWYGKQK